MESKQPNYRAYESEKKSIPRDLTPEQYQKEIKRIADKYRI